PNLAFVTAPHRLRAARSMAMRTTGTKSISRTDNDPRPPITKKPLIDLPIFRAPTIERIKKGESILLLSYGFIEAFDTGTRSSRRSLYFRTTSNPTGLQWDDDAFVESLYATLASWRIRSE